jgi:hypothetical protein
MREFILWTFFAAFALGGALMSLTDCAAAKSDVAEAGYLGAQLSCVDRYTTAATIDACRAEVRRAWGRLDGGSDAE